MTGWFRRQLNPIFLAAFAMAGAAALATPVSVAVRASESQSDQRNSEERTSPEEAPASACSLGRHFRQPDVCPELAWGSSAGHAAPSVKASRAPRYEADPRGAVAGRNGCGAALLI